MLSELESQNDEQVSEMSKKVGMLKDVSDSPCISNDEDEEDIRLTMCSHSSPSASATKSETRRLWRKR